MSGTIAFKGRSATLSISANGGSTFAVIGGVRTTNVTINNNPVDITNVGSAGFQEMLADGGTQSVSITIDGVVVDDTNFETFQAAVDDRTLVWYKFVFASGGIVTSQFAVSSFKIGAPHNGAQTFSADLMSSGVVSSMTPSS